MRQVLTESAFLSVSGGALGVLFASWATDASLSVLPSALPPSAAWPSTSGSFCFRWRCLYSPAHCSELRPPLKQPISL
jgi:hypothetical protein